MATDIRVNDMNAFKKFHPVTLFLYFTFVILISIFSFNPLCLIAGFLGAALFCACISDIKSVIKSLIIYFIIFIAVTFTNPLFSHNGVTILFFINDNRITLEALIYGAVLGFTIIEVVYWFKCFNIVFDSERLIYILGKIFPKLALVFSMTLRFIPKFIKCFKGVYNSQRLLYGKKYTLKRFLLSFSAVITQAMENSVITSDSMKARGYGLKRRTFYHRFSFNVRDLVFIMLSSGLFIVSLVCKSDFNYYPAFVFPIINLRNAAGYAAFTFLSFMPFIYEAEEGIRWKLSVSKI